MHPYLPATKLVNRFTPLMDYLSEHTGRDVRIRIGSTYQDHADAVGGGEVDIAFFGPGGYVMFSHEHGVPPLLGRLDFGGTSTFQGVVVTLKSSPFSTLSDLKGKRFAFGDPNSTMSSLVPRAMLKQAGVDTTDFASFEHLQNHHNVALAVMLKKYHAGSVKEEVYREYKARGLRALAWSPEISSHIFVASPLLPPEMTAKLRELFQTIHTDPNSQAILKGIKGKTKRIIPAKDADYETLRKLILSAE
uniref:Putative phosphonate ABC transporter, periplasmic phosphonate-binding protein n=1 Tax=Magnetococcus massalia (strain MO-1) TaxID=451514 RepID=A0A1S7LC99_MAGMO|nr:Putative phosphonate ABC transporter, periplasmic phosphonate-binding protein [Candidatus Magnetococcus massalia]